jgi:hypothetical protein
MNGFEKNISQWQHELENSPEVEDMVIVRELAILFVSIFVGGILTDWAPTPNERDC